MHFSGFSRFLAVAIIIACADSAFARPQEPLDELMACARTSELDARVACYEELGQRLLAEDATATVAATSTPQLSDRLGGDEFEKKAGIEITSNRGRIIGCKKGPDKKWYFYFESGQVWKQVKDRRLSLKEDCEMLATITEDVFGYKMKADSLKGTIRVSRRR